MLKATYLPYFQVPLAYTVLGMVIVLGWVYRKNWLTIQGCVAAFLLGISIVLLSHFYYLMPMIFFFFAGSLTSRLHVTPTNTTGRRAVQAFANGSVAVLCMASYAYSSESIFLMGYLTSICISMTDTCSSDLGVYFRQNTYDIITWKRVESGLSGGISIAGTLSGMLGAVMFIVFCQCIFELPYAISLFIFGGGISGMLADSIIGSLWQAKYSDGITIQEEQSSHNKLWKGAPWMTNDMVNIISNGLVTVLSLGLFVVYEI